ncbi:SRPBCC family protein [Planococcus sp. YIM B11945]|uniref:SRPBCC family protein n=1 Tax=Planococcus sp. YIM B11945 TaxID=3435410 RepID=UPI003D7CA609
MKSSNRSVFINASPETVWNSITKDGRFSTWYAPGSNWLIPKLEVGEKALFTLMPSDHNSLEEGESVPMSFTISEVLPLERFSYTSDLDGLVFTFDLYPEQDGTRVTVNHDGFDLSLENLKAFAEGKELPHI